MERNGLPRHLKLRHAWDKLIQERAFDWRHGVRTASHEGGTGNGHEPAWTSEIGHWYTWSRQCIPDNYTLVDVGSGRGKVLVRWGQLAAKQGDDRDLIGIDNDDTMVAAARANIARAGVKADVYKADAKTYTYPHFTLAWMYNPFGLPALRAWAEHVQDRRIVLLYNCPVHAGHLMDNGWRPLAWRLGYTGSATTLALCNH